MKWKDKAKLDIVSIWYWPQTFVQSRKNQLVTIFIFTSSLLFCPTLDLCYFPVKSGFGLFLIFMQISWNITAVSVNLLLLFCYVTFFVSSISCDEMINYVSLRDKQSLLIRNYTTNDLLIEFYVGTIFVLNEI